MLPTDLDPDVSAPARVVPLHGSAAEEPPVPGPASVETAPDRPRGEPRRFALLDALETFPLAPPVAAARELVDRVANIRVGEDGITLTGIWSRRIAWEHIDAIELSNRLDELLTVGLGFTPLGRVPRLHRLAESALLGTAERLAPLTLSRARDRAGWSVVRIHQQRRATELRRLPALVAHLYPETTRTILEVADRRGIQVVPDDDAGDA